MPLNKIVVWALYDAEKQSVLVERRPEVSDERYPGKLMFQSGAMEPDDGNNYHATLHREMREELGVLPVSYASLIERDNLDPPGRQNRMMAFLVWHWSPAILPDRVLDGGGDLHWVPLDCMQESPYERVRVVADAIAKMADRIDRVVMM